MRNILCFQNHDVVFGKSVISRAKRKRRRGVLLLVVLSMLVLFMLIGTAFLMSSSQQSKNSNNSAKMNSVGNPPTKDLDSALMQVLRDSDNEHSAIRYHSLLRDIYGTDGFQAVVDSATYARRIVSPPNQDNTPLGIATNGQFIDLYVVPPKPPIDDTATANIDESVNGLTKQHVLKLDRDGLNRPQLYTLSLTKGYFNGCLMTITSGSAAGQSTRIVEYQFVGDDAAIANLFTGKADTTTIPGVSRIWRFRVMAFSQSDGQALNVGTGTPPPITDLTSVSFIVNGRPFSGTGAGYNPFASLGQPRLNAVETVLMGSDLTKALYPEVALTPNAAYFFPSDPDRDPNSSHSDARGVRVPGIPGMAGTGGQPMNPKITTTMSAAQIATTLSQWRYPTFAGPGDVNESYDAADFQNMALALQTVTPRAQGRVVTDQGTFSMAEFLANPTGHGNFLRFDNEDVPLPSFHRPDLLNYWNHRLLGTLTSQQFGMSQDEAALAILDPYPNGTLRAGLDPSIAALITAIKRKASLRPLRADNPHFDGSNPLSVPPSSLSKNGLLVGDNITCPCSCTMGPWDVDNDNDGVPDSIWVDVGNPVQVAADGTRYKALVSYLIVDLDSRLNVNAHGLADDILPPALDSTKKTRFDQTMMLNGTPGNLAHVPVVGAISSTLQLPRGLGYGPADVSLRPLFPAPLNSASAPAYGNRVETIGAFKPVDDYAAILRGRILQDGGAVYGKYGLDSNTNGTAATAGTNYAFAVRRPNWKDDPNTVPDAPMWFSGERSTPGLAAQLKFFDYPWSNVQVTSYQSAFGTAPDVKARYALGLDYNGQPVYEVANDANPNDTKLPFNLLAKSPYELDLNSSQRRDHWGVSNYANSTFAFNSTVDLSDTGGQSGLNDDAPFSPTDLEKVLRAWDADAGTLPSRLWDCVSAFDPLKLGNTQYGDPNRILNIEKTAFGVGNPKVTDPEYLAAAQQVAGINRRLVTTDSFDLPVVGSTVPNQLSLSVGPDGQPGRADFDDDKVNGKDDAAEIGAPGTDDFKAIIGKEPARATIADLLQYRIWTEARRFEMRRQALTEASLAALNATDYAKFLSMVTARGQAVLAQSPQLLSDLIAPEVIGGNRMDLNRPFGDGRDNPDPITKISDGVVDDPLEAGDPFLDINGNGKWDNGEPFIDLGGNGYTPPGDQLWSDLTDSGKIGEKIGFDYTNGQATRIHAVLVNALKNIGGVHNLESQGRQLYARHLYCLMLLLADENYIAPWDESDPQVMTWMEAERKKLTSAAPVISPQEADYIVKRKLTCRMIAQWAVNCVDMRDADVIMTPFEYDENPWDGWGVWNDAWLGDITDKAVISKISFFPLDGDAATNENDGWVIDWSKIPAAGGPKVLAQLLVDPNQSVGPSNPPIITHPLNQTRGVVWGAERPELLMTETVGLHDRRTEDLRSNDQNGHSEMTNFDTNRPPGSSTPGHYKDPDPDQGLRPKGSLFVEVYNPWSVDGQKPAELYSRVDSSWQATNKTLLNPSNGVELGRLSNFAANSGGNITMDDSNAANSVKRSPVWRMIVVEEWPDSRNSDTEDKVRLDKVDPKKKQPYKFPATLDVEPKPYQTAADVVNKWVPKAATPNPPFRPSNPDFDEAFNAGYTPRQVGLGLNQFEVQYPYVEREFYFTTDGSSLLDHKWGDFNDKSKDFDYAEKNSFDPSKSFKLRVPYRVVDFRYSANGTVTTVPGNLQRFIDPLLENGSTQPVIAPILPGRYGVIGSSGTKYNADPTYTTTLGRRVPADATKINTVDGEHKPKETRRIELWPSADPNKQQIVVATNGGDPKDVMQDNATSKNKEYDVATKEIGRDNELINDNGSVKNIYLDAAGKNPDSLYFQPCVAIPVAGMNISEPAWGWAAREYEVAKEEALLRGGGNTPNLLKFVPSPGAPEGRYKSGGGNTTDPYESYDIPFDGYCDVDKSGNYTDKTGKVIQSDQVDKTEKLAPELLRNGTTANYRTVHLQRLANPMLPWNPLPGQFFKPAPTGTGKVDMYQPNLPINPYRTVDTASVDLTAFNGVSRAEAGYPVAALVQEKLLQWRPWQEGEKTKYKDKFYVGKQAWHLRSSERGGWARLNVLGAAATPATSPPQRVLWAQEPAMLKFNLPGKDLFNLLTDRQMTTRAAEADKNESQTSDTPWLEENRVQMVLEHSLGYGNKSFGLLYDKRGSQGAKSLAPTAVAVGAPAPDNFVWDLDSKDAATLPPIKVDSTNPWFAWNNRPYVSAEELLNVPAASQATMLRMYSTIDPNKAANITPNTYGLAQLGTPAATLPTTLNAIRFVVMQAPFGQMLNVFAASNVPAGYANGTGDIIPYGAPNFYRILDYVQVPSRFVGTDTMLNAETFSDNPSVSNVVDDIASPNDPRYSFQPPFNKVSQERDPGRVNLNTVTGRRTIDSNGIPHHWSEVFDGIMHRSTIGDLKPTPHFIAGDGNILDAAGNVIELGQPGPAWRDVVLSRRGYAQFDASGVSVDKNGAAPPDVYGYGLNSSFPTIFANPFRSADAGDLVPLEQMMQYGVDASLLRKHPYDRGKDANQVWQPWGPSPMNFGDARDAGYGANEKVSSRPPTPANPEGAIPDVDPSKRDILPLFSEKRDTPYSDSDRNPYNMYQPMTRLGNLVTDRSNVYAVWITIGYFEVEPAPNWNETRDLNGNGISDGQETQARFGGDGNANSPATIAALALYNRVYPEGYMLGRELGSDTGNVTRPRGFYIIDRSEPVGFKPGEDLNVEKAIRLRRRIE